MGGDWFSGQKRELNPGGVGRLLLLLLLLLDRRQLCPNLPPVDPPLVLLEVSLLPESVSALAAAERTLGLISLHPLTLQIKSSLVGLSAGL